MTEPLVSILMGSKSDLDVMQPARDALVELGVEHEVRVLSAHRTPDALFAYLADKGYDKDNGARPLSRVIQEEVKRPLGEELLFGALENGGHVIVDVAGTGPAAKIVFRFAKPS